MSVSLFSINLETRRTLGPAGENNKMLENTMLHGHYPLPKHGILRRCQEDTESPCAVFPFANLPAAEMGFHVRGPAPYRPFTEKRIGYKGHLSGGRFLNAA